MATVTRGTNLTRLSPIQFSRSVFDTTFFASCDLNLYSVVQNCVLWSKIVRLDLFSQYLEGNEKEPDEAMIVKEMECSIYVNDQRNFNWDLHRRILHHLRLGEHLAFS